MSSFTRVATGPRLPHPARSESPPLVLAVVGAILVYSPPRPRPGCWTGRSRAYLADSSRYEPSVRESKLDARLSSARPLEAVDLPSPTPPPSPEDSLSRGGKIQLCTSQRLEPIRAFASRTGREVSLFRRAPKPRLLCPLWQGSLSVQPTQ